MDVGTGFVMITGIDHHGFHCNVCLTLRVTQTEGARPDLLKLWWPGNCKRNRVPFDIVPPLLQNDDYHSKVDLDLPQQYCSRENHTPQHPRHSELQEPPVMATHPTLEFLHQSNPLALPNKTQTKRN